MVFFSVKIVQVIYRNRAKTRFLQTRSHCSKWYFVTTWQVTCIEDLLQENRASDGVRRTDQFYRHAEMLSKRPSQSFIRHKPEKGLMAVMLSHSKKRPARVHVRWQRSDRRTSSVPNEHSSALEPSSIAIFCYHDNRKMAQETSRSCRTCTCVSSFTFPFIFTAVLFSPCSCPSDSNHSVRLIADRVGCGRTKPLLVFWIAKGSPTWLRTQPCDLDVWLCGTPISSSAKVHSADTLCAMESRKRFADARRWCWCWCAVFGDFAKSFAQLEHILYDTTNKVQMDWVQEGGHRWGGNAQVLRWFSVQRTRAKG